MKPSDFLYCVDCEELFPLEGHRNCASCGSSSVLPLQRVMKTEEEPVNPCPPPVPWPLENLRGMRQVTTFEEQMADFHRVRGLGTLERLQG